MERRRVVHDGCPPAASGQAIDQLWVIDVPLRKKKTYMLKNLNASNSGSATEWLRASGLESVAVRVLQSSDTEFLFLRTPDSAVSVEGAR